MFCSANDCACRPDTAVVNASKIPMTLPLQLDPQRHEVGPRDGWPNAVHLPAIRVPVYLSLYVNILGGTARLPPGPDMPTYRQILPARNAPRPRHDRAAAPCERQVCRVLIRPRMIPKKPALGLDPRVAPGFRIRSCANKIHTERILNAL